MKKAKSVSLNHLVEYVYKKQLAIRFSKSEQSTKSGIYAGIGVLLLIMFSFSVFTGVRSIFASPTYASLDVSPKTTFTTLDDSQKVRKDVTLVLHRTGCRACISVEKPLSRELHVLRSNNPKRPYIVTDLAKMSSTQFQKLKKELPGILIYTDRVPTPLVANLHYSNGRWHVKQLSNTADKQKIQAVLDKSLQQSAGDKNK